MSVCDFTNFIDELCLFKLDTGHGALSWLVIAAEIVAFFVAFRLMNVAVSDYLDPCMQTLRARMKLTPSMSQWFLAALVACAPDLLISIVLTINQQESRAVSRLFGYSWALLLVLPAVTRVYARQDSEAEPLTSSTVVACLFFCMAFGALFWTLRDGEGTVSATESGVMLLLYGFFMATGSLLDATFPDLQETTQLAIVEMQQIQITEFGTQSTPFLLPELAFETPVEVRSKPDWAQRVMSRFLLPCARGSRLERFFLVGLVLAYFWIFFISLVLDAVTTRFMALFGASDRFVGSVILALAAIMPELVRAIDKGERVDLSRSELTRVNFKILVSLALPWLFKAWITGRDVLVAGSAISSTLGSLLTVAALGVSLLARRVTSKQKAVRILLGCYVVFVSTYALVI